MTTAMGSAPGTPDHSAGTSRKAWRVLLLLVAGVLGGVSCDGVTDEELRAIEAWLTCDECVHGERAAVEGIGSPAIPLLAEALAGLPEEVVDNLRGKFAADYRLLADVVPDSAAYVNQYVGELDALIKRRAAISLADLGAVDTLRVALDSAAVRGYPAEVVSEIQRAIYAATDSVQWLAVSAGALHTCALAVGGDVYCWGSNVNGQLGDGSTSDRSRPGRLSVPTRFASLNASAGLHACAVRDDGVPYCWGRNSRGQLGRPPSPLDSVPARASTVDTGTGARVELRTIVTGDAFTCADSAGGSVFCWGGNDRGQLGDGTDTDRWEPRPVRRVGGPILVGGVSAGVSHACATALVTEGPLTPAYCWGANDQGQLGTNDLRYRPLATRVVGDSWFASVSAGANHTCGRTADNVGYCWGSNEHGQLGLGAPVPVRRTTPILIAGGHEFTALTGGASHTCGLTPAGSALCWGLNSDGQLGDSSTTTRSAPVPVHGTTTFSSLSAGAVHTCGVAADSTLLCWGNNANGQLGTGTSTGSMMPVPVAPPEWR